MNSFLIKLGRLSFLFIPFLLVSTLALGYLERVLVYPLDPEFSGKVPYIVSKDTNLKKISIELAEKRITRAWFSVYFYKLMKKGGEIIQVGEYEFSPSMSPKEIFSALVSSKVVYHSVTIPEGTNINAIPKIFAKTGIVTESEVKQALFNKNLLSKLEISGGTLEGWIFPETYNISRPSTAEEIIIRIVSEGRGRIDSHLRGWRERATQLKLTPQQIMILASIIEAETQKPSERTLVSSVYHNRLRIEMPLQSDPTVIYGIPNFNGNLTKENLKTPGPYNTYLNLGLPPSPICNPGIESIKAALYPDETDYIYFVGKGDGSHHFSATYKEHQQAVNNFQKVKVQN